MPAIVVIRQEVSNQSQEVSAPIERQPFQGMFVGNEIMEVAAVPQDQEPWRQSTWDKTWIFPPSSLQTFANAFCCMNPGRRLRSEHRRLHTQRSLGNVVLCHSHTRKANVGIWGYQNKDSVHQHAIYFALLIVYPFKCQNYTFLWQFY